MARLGKQKRRKKKVKLNPAQKLQRRRQKAFRNNIKKLFVKADFKLLSTRGKEVTFKGMTSEFDFIFVYENIVVIAEDTISASDYVHAHLLKKDAFYKQILGHKDDFLELLSRNFPELKKLKADKYAPADCKVLIAYCTKEKIQERHKRAFSDIHFIEDRDVQYFLSLANTIGQTMKYELIKFFGLHTQDIGISTGSNSRSYNGFILPESPSGFPAGYKIVTFYVDPETLMQMAYVLRKDGWIAGENLYQRMISRSKIRNMRQYLAEDKRVFINNVIVSLPASTKVLDPKSRTQIDVEKIQKTTSVTVEVPLNFNSIGVIDGQHRLFAYHEGEDSFESLISVKRQKQQLLVTGIVYPTAEAEKEHREFEARLFLEINDKQTKTRPELRQAIESIVNPFSVIAIARSVVAKLSSDGPLCGILEEHQFEKGKLKSSSIVSYGIKHIVKCEGEDSLFKIWRHNRKDAFAKAVKAASSGKRNFSSPPKSVLADYVDFCTSHINNILTAYARAVKEKGLWTANRKESVAITTTAINGVIFSLRRLLEADSTGSLDEYFKAFKKMSLDFRPGKFKYSSSHWNDLGNDIVYECFGISKPKA
jgi:DGQHR domain-containing protein